MIMTVVALLLAFAAVVGLVGFAAMARAGRGFAVFVSACCLAMLGLYAGLLAAWLEWTR